MAEVLLSPGVLARENDNSFLTAQPIQAGAAIVGPTVKGPVGIPTLVTTYSDYQNRFGAVVESGSAEYTYFTSISAYNYFQQGGDSLLVTRVVSGSYTSATSSNIPNNLESGVIDSGSNLLSSTVGGGGGDATFSGTPSFTGGSGTGLTLNAEVTTFGGIKTSTDALLTSITVNPVDAVDGTYATTILSGGTGTNLIASIVVSGQTITGITVPISTSGSGYAVGDSLTIAAGDLSDGELIGAQDVLGISNGGAYALGAVTGPFTVVQSSTTGTGIGASFVITGDGVNVSALTVSAIGTGHVATDIITISAADLITAGFAGAAGALEITLTSSNVELSSAGTIVLVADDLFYSLTALSTSTEGTGYVVGDELVITAGDMGTNSTEATITLVGANIVDGANTFTLETLSEGVNQNSTSALGSAGQLASGTADNIRWEITAPNTGSGTFALLIRRGDDITNSKTILETWAGLSLDPNANNYIEKVIGNSKQTVANDNGEYYIQNDGTYNTLSRYVRVKSVVAKTLNYFDNAGNAKPEFTSLIPIASEGTVGSATGTPFTSANSPALFYDKISNINTQGFDGDALDDTSSNGSYAVALNLLANRDLFNYNLITAPGLIKENDKATGELLTMVNTAQSRGDNLAIVDLKNYGSGILPVTAGAAAIDSSYAATYWPWLQTIDPDKGGQVWVPASTMIPGVYAFNDRSGEAWFAPAGLSRGGLSTVLRAERNLTNGNRNTLYEANVNPIATFPNVGVVVFGQKTLQKKASALDRINVRRLLIELKSYISQIADNLVFEQNTIATRNNFLTQVNPYLESVQQRQGLYAFKVVMDDSNNTPDVIDRNELVGQIYIQPTKTAEFIYLDFNVMPTGATFPS